MVKKLSEKSIRHGHVRVRKYVNDIISYFERNKVELHDIASVRQKLKRYLSNSNSNAKLQLWDVIARHCLCILNRVKLTKKHELLFRNLMELKAHLDIQETFTHKDVTALYNEWAS